MVLCENVLLVVPDRSEGWGWMRVWDTNLYESVNLGFLFVLDTTLRFYPLFRPDMRGWIVTRWRSMRDHSVRKFLVVTAVQVILLISRWIVMSWNTRDRTAWKMSHCARCSFILDMQRWNMNDRPLKKVHNYFFIPAIKGVCHELKYERPTCNIYPTTTAVQSYLISGVDSQSRSMRPTSMKVSNCDSCSFHRLYEGRIVTICPVWKFPTLVIVHS